MGTLTSEIPALPDELIDEAEEFYDTPAPPLRTLLRFAVAVLLTPVVFQAPFIGFGSVLVPAKLEQIAPDSKVVVLSMLQIAGALTAAVAAILFGSLSDRTRSTFGARTPWILTGSLGTAASFATIAFVDSVALLILLWIVSQVFMNMIVAAILALIPDQVPLRHRGTFSALFATGLLVGGFAAQMAVSPFVLTPEIGMIGLSVVTLLLGLVVTGLSISSSNLHLPRMPITRRILVDPFRFPTRGALAFYLVLAGRTLATAGMYAFTAFQLYILTDFIGVDATTAGGIIAVMAACQLGIGIVLGLVAGPVSDRLPSRKPLMIAAIAMIAAGVATPLVVREPWAMVALAVLLGSGNAIFLTVAQSMSYMVVTDPKEAAKEIGILNLGTTGGNLIAITGVSVLVALTGGYAAVFIGSLVVLLGAAVCFTIVRRPARSLL